MATLTFNPDASAETTSVDGQAGRVVTNSLWDDIHGGNGTATDDDDPVNRANASQDYGQTTTDRWDNFHRGMLNFDTRSLGASATVSAAEFQLVLTQKDDDFTDYARLVNHETYYRGEAPNFRAISVQDYQTAAAFTTAHATDITVANLNADSSTFNAWTLNATGIAYIKTEGVTEFGVRVGIDIADSDPGGWVLHAQKQTLIVWATADETLSGDKKPRLVVTYTVARNPRSIMF
jgi:hypothetical protein